MADQDYEISAKLKWDSDNSILVEAQTEAKHLNDLIDQQGEIVDQAASKLASYFGIWQMAKEAWNLVREGTQEYMAQERALNALSNAAVQFGQDGKVAAEAAETLALRLAAAGFSETEIVKGAQRLTIVTHDYEMALSGASLAADIAAKSGMDYGQALEIIRNLLTGSERGVLAANRQLGIEATTASEALAKLNAQFRGGVDALDDSTKKVASFTSLLKEGFKDLGGVVAGALGIAGKALTGFVRGEANASLEIEHWFRRMFGDTADADKWYADALKKWKEKFGIPIAGEMKKLEPGDAAKQKEWEKALKERADSTTSALKNIEKAMEDVQKEDDERKREQEKNLREAVRIYEETENFKAQFLHHFNMEQKRENEQAAREAMEASHKTAEGFIADNRRIERIREELANKYKRWTKEELEAKLEELKSIEHAEANAADAIAEINKRLAQAKIQSDLDAAAASAQSLGQMFHQQKAAALATAVIHAFKAAAGASADTPGDMYTRIAAYLAVLAEVWNAVTGISGTEIGSGGGGMTGAQSVSVRAPASTYNPNGTQNPQSVSTTNVNTNAPSTSQINIYAIDTNNALRTLQQNFRPASRSYDRGIVSRPTTSIGSRRSAG